MYIVHTAASCGSQREGPPVCVVERGATRPGGNAASAMTCGGHCIAPPQSGWRHPNEDS